MNYKATVVFALLAALSSAGAGEKSTFDLTWENDSFLDLFGGRYNDRHYTQGLAFSYFHPDAIKADDFFLSSEITRLVAELGMNIEATRGGIAFGQQMYTPENIALGRFEIGHSRDDDRLQEDDRPYAGYLYLEPQWGRWQFFIARDIALESPRVKRNPVMNAPKPWPME